MAKADTAERILGAALGLFRKKGFDATTMRDIAKAAGMSLGAAYYYYPSKEALVLAWYEQQNAEHERRMEKIFAETDDLRERLLALYRVRFELMRRDRLFLSGLFRTVADPQSPASIFAEETRGLRARGLTVTRRALDLPGIPEDAKEALSLGLWALGMVLALYFVHDESKQQARTHELVEGVVDLLLPLVPLMSIPVAQAFREQALGLLERAGLRPPAGASQAVK
jgi:AcrR family transcriptional regulator